MPVITMCSTKGGVGKSTMALVLANVFAKAGSKVKLIDADPNQPLVTWMKRSVDTVLKNIEVSGNITEQNIVSCIDDAVERFPFVIVDLEGSANLAASFAIGRSDLVLVPMRKKQLDGDQVGKIITLITQQSQFFRRKIPFRIVFSMTNTLNSREAQHIEKILEKSNIPILSASLTERAAYSALFQIGGSLFDLSPTDVNNPQAAQENAMVFANAVVKILDNENLLKGKVA
ncbi:chromosome partitioning protein [Bartonella japonica]|uniref:Chromosome partitioning protein n=1 Tax=Bartonella japonica TaxID=357761 RepID=A0ABV2FLY1_9HYPH